MRAITLWPWITLLVAIAAAFNPIGYDIIHNAYFSGEQLSRSIGQFMVYCALGFLAAMAFVEFGIRNVMISRQRRLASGATDG